METNTKTILKGGPGTGKTRVAYLIAEYVGKEKTVLLDGRNNNYDNFFLSEVNENTELIIIDDCPLSFDYSRFMGSELRIEKQCKKAFYIKTPSMIFITSKENQILSNLFAKNGFEVISFPLHK